MTAPEPTGYEAACSALVSACARAQMTRAMLFLHYIGLGGLGSMSQVTDHCSGGPLLPVSEHNVLVQAVNERFLEAGDFERLAFQ